MIRSLVAIAAALVFAISLSGCGGSGAGGDNGSSIALSTTAQSSITLPAGEQTFAVSGGAAPYTVTSSDVSVATARIDTGTSLVISAVTGATPGGTATIEVKDSKSAAVTIAVKIGATVALSTTAPLTTNLEIGAVSAEFSIMGGTMPYAVVSNNSSIATIGVNGSKFIISGVKAGTAEIAISDAVGAFLPVRTVRVGSTTALYTTAPGTVTLEPAASATYTIRGGSPQYSAVSDNEAVATASVSGTTLTVLAKSAAGTAHISVTDQGGQTVSITVLVASSKPLFTQAPGALTLPVGRTETYAISGGNPPYTVTSSNVNLVTAAVSASGSSMTITGVALGNATSVLLRDAAGATVTINVTVGTGSGIALYTTAPSALTVGKGNTPTYTVGGGTPPYYALSANGGLVSASISGNTLTIGGLALSAAGIDVVVRDSLGATVTTTVTVGATGAPLKIENSGVAQFLVGMSVRLLVTGGTKPYLAFSTFPDVATANLGKIVNGVFTPSVSGDTTGDTIDIYAKSPADPATVTVQDALGATVSYSFTIVPGSVGFRLAPYLLTVSAGQSAAATYTIEGGVGPYRAYSSDATLATVTAGAIGASGVTTATFSVAGTAKVPTASTIVTITVVDAQGNVTTATFVVVVSGTDAPPSNPPTNVVATNAGAGVLRVSFSPPFANTGSPITGYTATCGTKSQSGAGSPIDVAGLVDGTPVVCTVAATNSAGSGPVGVAPAATPGAAPSHPPTNVVATNAGAGTLSVAFVPPASNTGLPITGYTATCGGISNTGGASPIVVAGLPVGVPVICSVAATNSVGSGPVGVAPASTP